VNFKRINAILTLTANVGVLIGVLLVAYELRQNDNTLNASIQLSLSNSYEELATLALENPHLAEGIVRLFGGEALEGNDVLNIMGWQARHLQVLHTTYNLYRDGIVLEDFWREKASHFTVFMAQSDRFTAIYEQGKHDEIFSRDFEAAIDAIYQEQLAARAEATQ
jgi:hypothetical protein